MHVRHSLSYGFTLPQKCTSRTLVPQSGKITHHGGEKTSVDGPKMIFHHIELTKVGLGQSGGETCMLGLIRELRAAHQNIIYTSEHGAETYRKQGVLGTNITYVPIGTYAVEKRFGVLVSWLCRTWTSRRYIKKLSSDEQHVMISHSDFFPSVLFAYWMKRKNPGMKWLAFCHLLAPNPFKGPKWQFVLGKWTIPSLTSIYFWLSQRMFFLLQRRADALVSVNSGYIPYLKKQHRTVAIIRNCADAEVTAYADTHTPISEPRYDVCFLGRFHEQKGILEFVDIVHRLVHSGSPTIKCLVIGGYDNPMGQRVVERIKQLKLTSFIDLVGVKEGDEKCTLLSQAKVFVFPSYYESFGIVYLEAITLGIPVVEYDLPIYQDHCKGVVKVPYLDNAAMACAIQKLLDDTARRTSLAQEGREYARQFKWQQAAEVLLQL